MKNNNSWLLLAIFILCFVLGAALGWFGVLVGIIASAGIWSCRDTGATNGNAQEAVSGVHGVQSGTPRQESVQEENRNQT